jgi:hypothetical protein
MDGYSVTEAASVLGVPIERVWELLARGVLAGTPEGETGMRVFLQPRPAAAPAAGGPSPANGGGAEPERELSPFRELLTEFRNLTERYGQALLALGESRGEVAALRSRVDLLETRMDMGLPGPGAQRMAAGWAGGAQPYGFEQSVIPTATTPSEPASGPEESADAEEHRARPRGPRRATESFAEALARAEDPSPPELPAAEAMDPGAHTRQEPEASEAGLPRELPAAEPVPVADEPDALVDRSAPPEAEAEVVPEPGEEAVVTDTAPVPEGIAEVARVPEPVSESVEPMRWDADRYSTAIEEPDWFEAEAEGPEIAPQAAEEVREPEETLFWLRDAAADDAGLTDDPPPPEPVTEILPGADELDSALDALGAIGGTPASGQPDVASAPPEPPSPTVGGTPVPPRTGLPPAVPPSALRYRPVAPPGPTGRAYRRLRRIFPD